MRNKAPWLIFAVRSMGASFFAIAMGATALADEQGPGEYIEKSPRGRFTITQRWVKPDYIATDADCDDSDCGWQAVLKFADNSKQEVTLAAHPEWYAWPAVYSISPDEQWIIRQQKTGSGESALFLYRIGPNAQVWRMAQPLDDLIFATLLAPKHRTRDDYYHLEVIVVSWALSTGRVHLRAYATPNDRDQEALRGRAVTFDLKKHTVRPE
jgi:hypothetical protein